MHIYILQFLCYFLLTWIIQDSSIGISTIRAENATVSKKLTNWDRNSLTIGLVKSNYRKMEYPFHSQAYYRRLEIIEELKNVGDYLNEYVHIFIHYRY